MLRLLLNAEHGASSGALVLQTAPMHPWLNMAVYMLAYLLFVATQLSKISVLSCTQALSSRSFPQVFTVRPNTPRLDPR